MGNLITYNGDLSVRTADINMAKLHWNRVVSTPNAKYMCLDIKKNYLTAALEYYKYMKMPLSLFLIWIVGQYDLNTHAKHGWVHLEMQCAVWGLPQAGILANKHLRRKLAPFGYHECVNTSSLWYHETRPITFTLVVNNFGVKYVNKADVDHLIASIKIHTHSPRIGPATCIAGFNSNGTTTHKLWIYQCRDILRTSCRNMNMW
jgi:hypothetical protein